MPFCKNNVIHRIYAHQLEAQLSTCLDIAYCEMKTAAAKVEWYSAKHRVGVCMLQEVLYRFYILCIARATVNESLCEDLEYSVVIFMSLLQ